MVSLLHGLPEAPTEVSVVTLAFGYSGEWDGARGRAVAGTAAGVAAEVGISSPVAQVWMDSCRSQYYHY